MASKVSVNGEDIHPIFKWLCSQENESFNGPIKWNFEKFIIDEKGNVINVEIKQSSDPIFDRPTIEAIRGWKFTPGEKDGRAVKTRTRVKIPYTLK